MRAMYLILLIVAVVAANAHSTIDLKDSANLFKKFVEHYNRQYIDEADRLIHYNAFVKNLNSINELNAISPETIYGITQFTDLTDEEKKLYGMGRSRRSMTLMA